MRRAPSLESGGNINNNSQPHHHAMPYARNGNDTGQTGQTGQTHGLSDMYGDVPQTTGLWGPGMEEGGIARRVLEGRVHGMTQENESLRAIINMLV